MSAASGAASGAGAASSAAAAATPAGPPSEVTLHMYDLSQGMAAQMSQMMTGTHFDGIWHTGICIWGEEYYYQGGLQYTAEGKSPFGAPTRVLKLGTTVIPRAVFMDFCRGLAARFTPEAYHVLAHNCNGFTEECSQFLLGRSIPEEVSGLPERFAQTPLGQMLTPMIDQMMQQQQQAMAENPGMMASGGGGLGFGQFGGATPIRPFAPGEGPAEPPRGASAAASAAAPAAAKRAILSYKSAILFTTGNVAQICEKMGQALDGASAGWREGTAGSGEGGRGAQLAALQSFAVSTQSRGGRPAREGETAVAFDAAWLDLLQWALDTLPAARQFMALDLMRFVLLDRAANAEAAAARVPAILARFLGEDPAQAETPPAALPYALHLMLTRVAGNAFASSTGAAAVLDTAGPAGGSTRTARALTIDVTLRGMLGKDARLRAAAVTVAFNIATKLPDEDEDSAVELGSALIHLLNPDDDDETSASSTAAAAAAADSAATKAAIDTETEFTALAAVGHLLQRFEGLKDLAAALGLDPARHAAGTSSDKIRDVAAELQQLM